MFYASLIVDSSEGKKQRGGGEYFGAARS